MYFNATFTGSQLAAIQFLIKKHAPAHGTLQLHDGMRIHAKDLGTLAQNLQATEQLARVRHELKADRLVTAFICGKWRKVEDVKRYRGTLMVWVVCDNGDDWHEAFELRFHNA